MLIWIKEVRTWTTLTELHPLLTFWSVFWVGSIVAVFALWSALYRGTEPAMGK